MRFLYGARVRAGRAKRAGPRGAKSRDPATHGDPANHGDLANRGDLAADSPRWAKLVLVIGSVLAVLSGLFVVGSKALDAYLSGSVKHEALLTGDLAPQGKSIAGPLNILLLGMDERTNNTDYIRTDSIIIVHVNANHDSVSLVSLPRDARAEVPAFPATEFAGGFAKLGEAFSLANRTRDANGGWVGDPTTAGRQRGVELLVRTINGLVPGGLPFNAVAIINHAGFRRLVEAMGGVYMCIDERVVSDHYDRNGRYVDVTVERGIPGYVYERGCRTLKAWEALDYVRQRKHLELGDGDYGRQRHQQQFLYAVFKQLLSRKTLTDVGKFNELRAAAGELLTLDLGGVSVIDWIYSFRGLDTSDVTLIKTNGGKYATRVIGNTDYEELTGESLDLLKAVQSDQVYDFVVRHPEWVAEPG